jgi:RNA polymerase sigma-70 factor (ECF subfamily)
MRTLTPGPPTDPDDLGDAELLKCFQATGDTRHIEKLWRKYARPVYQACLRFLRNNADAEDVAADVFVKVMNNLRAQYRPDHFRGWLFTLAKHECINRVQRAAERLRGGDTDDLVLATSDDPTLAIDVSGVLGQLSAPQRIAIKLLYVNRYTYEEIAELKGWPVNEVKSHVQNGRRMFKKLWATRSQRRAT